MLCLRISFSRHGSNIRHLWSFSAATRLRAYKFHGNAVRVNASSYEADDRNLLSGEFYCASSYSEHVTEREIARLPKFRSRLGIVNFPIVLRQIFVISARTDPPARRVPKSALCLRIIYSRTFDRWRLKAGTFCEQAFCFVNNVAMWSIVKQTIPLDNEEMGESEEPCRLNGSAPESLFEILTARSIVSLHKHFSSSRESLQILNRHHFRKK